MSRQPDPATLRQAAQLIREHGLATGVFVDEYNAHCTVGALREVKGRHWSHFEAEILLLADLIGTPAQVPSPEGTIPGFHEVTRWNDALERTADDVILLLEQAAEKLEADR